MVSPLRDTLFSLFSRIFPRTHDIELHVDATTHGDYVYADVRLIHKDGSLRINDLRSIPSRIRVGSRYVRVSQKNRSTLKHLADWDPSFDPRRGFVFYEKDVPEILNYLGTKASVHFSDAAQQVKVDVRPLEYVHDVRESGKDVEIATGLSDPDSTVTIENEKQARFLPDSKYVHAKEGYFKKPPKKEYRTFRPELGRTILKGDQIPLFLIYDLKRLRAETRARVAPEVEAQRVVAIPFEAQVSLDVEGPWLWLDVRYQADRFKIPYQDIEDTAKEQQFLREEEAWIQIDRQTHSKLARQIEQIPELEVVEGRFRTPSRFCHDVQELLEQIAHVDPSEAYSKFLNALRDFSRIKEQPLPYSFRGQLRVYQKHGYDWLCFLRQYGLAGILADEMGLGKTVQTLVALLEAHSLRDAGTSLIVCPPSVLSAWDDDIRKFASPTDFRVGHYIGTNRQQLLHRLNQYDALLTTYTIVLKDLDYLSSVLWEYVVLDEAQKIKNQDAATARACKSLLARHKIALTGTPIENRLSELWSIYDFLMPSYLGGQSSFRDNYEIPIMKYSNRKATEDLKKRINPFKLRRLKAQVAAELPEKIYMDRACELTPEQVQLYKQYAYAEQEKIRNLPASTVRIDTSVLTAILRLKQISCHPALVTPHNQEIYGRSGKLDAFGEILEELSETGEKALIFSQFTEMLAILRRVFEDQHIPHFYLDGSTSIKERSRMKDDFQRGAVPYFLISLRAGGLGMTLTEANCVVHYDQWWNPAVQDQATDRVHRIGQTKNVKVFRIRVVGTIEERIEQLLVKKKNLFDSVIEVDDLKKEISKEELLALFAPPA